MQSRARPYPVEQGHVETGRGSASGGRAAVTFFWPRSSQSCRLFCSTVYPGPPFVGEEKVKMIKSTTGRPFGTSKSRSSLITCRRGGVVSFCMAMLRGSSSRSDHLLTDRLLTDHLHHQKRPSALCTPIPSLHQPLSSCATPATATATPPLPGSPPFPARPSLASRLTRPSEFVIGHLPSGGGNPTAVGRSGLDGVRTGDGRAAGTEAEDFSRCFVSTAPHQSSVRGPHDCPLVAAKGIHGHSPRSVTGTLVLDLAGLGFDALRGEGKVGVGRIPQRRLDLAALRKLPRLLG